MITLIGSAAANMHFPDFRYAKDVDYHSSFADDATVTLKNDGCDVFVDDRRKDFDRMFDRSVTVDKITASSLYLHEIDPPDEAYTLEDLYIKEDSDGKKWFEVKGVLPPEVGITDPEGLSVDTPPGDVLH